MTKYITTDAAPDEHAPPPPPTPINDPRLDGPCHPYSFRQRGKVISGHMQPAAWNLVNYIWQQRDCAATFADLKEPVYDDREHLAGIEAFGALRRAANAFFKTHRLHWRVHIKKKVVYLSCSK